MDAQEAQMRRKTWFGIPCYHPVLEQETLNESWTGLYVCQDCGSEFLKVSMWEPVHHFFLQEKKHLAFSEQMREVNERERQQPLQEVVMSEN